MPKFDEDLLFDNDHARVYDEALRELIANHRVELMYLINTKLVEHDMDPLDETLL